MDKPSVSYCREVELPKDIGDVDGISDQLREGLGVGILDLILVAEYFGV